MSRPSVSYLCGTCGRRCKFAIITHVMEKHPDEFRENIERMYRQVSQDPHAGMECIRCQEVFQTAEILHAVEEHYQIVRAILLDAFFKEETSGIERSESQND